MEKDKKFGDISPVGRKLSHGVVTITVIDCSEEHLQYMERYRDDGFEKQLEFVFDTTSRQQFSNLYMGDDFRNYPDEEIVEEHRHCYEKHGCNIDIDDFLNREFRELFRKHFRELLQKTVDEYEKHGIICVSAKKYPISCIEAQFTTGGRLGVRQCQM